ncbi:MAG: glycosyltransferase [bacterium]
MKKTPRIALVHDFIFTYGGAERVLAIFHELYPDAPIYTLFAEPEIVAKHYPKATIVTSFLQKSRLRRWPPLMLGMMPRAVESFDFTGFDVVLSSSGAFSHGVITGPETIHLCYCHTPMRYAWDWHNEYLGERGLTKFPSGILSRALLSRLRLWDKVSASRVDRFLCNSGVVASRIKKFYRQDATVVYPPIDTVNLDYAKVELKTPERPYAISASRLTPNKRIDRVIRGCALAKIPLVIAGGGSQREELEKVAKEAGGEVTFAGYVSEDEKRSLIANASCFIFSAEDDFGIGPAEALAMGVPLITLKRGGIQEVVQEGVNGLFFKEATPEAISEVLAKFLKEGVSGDRKHIRESVLNLSEEHFRNQIREAVDNA